MPEAGEILDDRYQLQHIVGQGGLGVVYKAFDPIEKRKVAIKLLLGADSSTGEQSMARRFFEREIGLLKQIKHPNIVSVFDSGIVAGKRYLVMEYIEGSTL